MSAPLIEARDIRLSFAVGNRRWLVGARPRIDILHGVSLTAARGETIGIVGESGSGKTTLGRCLVRLHKPTGGTVRFDGADITRRTEDEMRPLRRRLQMIFQDPLSSLNPRQTIRTILDRPLSIHRTELTAGGRAERATELLGEVGLDREHLDRYPHELSGGQRQRVGIARALAAEPDFVLADEIVSGLDVSTQAQVLRLLRDLSERRNLTVALISHDLSVVRHLCERVYVMRHGRVVEEGPSERLFSSPRSAYTRELIAAIPLPEPDPEWLDRSAATGRTGMKIKDSVAFVTGTNRGVGTCFLEALAGRGVKKIYAAARNTAGLPSEIGGVPIVPVSLDITDRAQIEAAAKAAADVNLLINNAGVNHNIHLMASGSNASAETEIRTNYLGLLDMARAFHPVLKGNGGGAMINMLSILSLINLPIMGSLAASKAAAYSATQGIRAEWQNDNIQVLAVMPGAIDTDMSRNMPPPKENPMDVAVAALDALEAGEWECFPGGMAQGIKAGLEADPIAVQKDMMQYV
ncbi:MAG: SDR family NAD(P)-dependent oxidoreductase [Minwuia sp.]|uniref:SDR family NAD(P)-dependent oxidoreductase n=1 Tax=Minwuia sp. TaxID=2493630 RepID=UPI003A86B0AC